MKRTLLILLVVTCTLATSTAEAKRRRRRTPRKEKPAAAAPADPADQIVVGDAPEPAASSGKASGKGKDKVFDFTGLNIEGKLRTPQLLYFLGRARQELERASLESRSFIPEMVRSIDEEGL